MYGAITKGSLIPGISDLLMEFNAAGTFAAGDFVKFDGSTGELVVATAGANILGVAKEAATAASTGVSVNCTPKLVVIMDNDEDGGAAAATNVGEWADFTGATQLMQIDTSTLSTSVAQLFYLKNNPQGVDRDSDTSVGKAMVAEMYLTA